MLTRLTLVTWFVSCLILPVAGARAGDWPQWGGTGNRNLVSDETGLPDSFKPGKKSPSGRGIDMSTTKNVKWVAKLGTFAYGNPTISNGKVFVGTDDITLADDPRFKRSKGGLVKCLDEETGELLWQLAIPKRPDSRLPEKTHFTHQHLGVCSSPTVDGNRVYVVTSAADIVCLDVNGQADGNDGPFVDEATYMVPDGEPPLELKPSDADIIWRFDPIDEIGVVPHDAASCALLVSGDVVYSGTSNGVDEAHTSVLAPLAPSLIGLDKRTGRLVATDDAKIGTRMYHAQWCSPSLGEVNGKKLIFLGGGDGVCYAFEAISTALQNPTHLKQVWSFDCLPRDFRYRDGKLIDYYDGDRRKERRRRPHGNVNDGTFMGPSQIIATPVFTNGRIYVAIGQDPAHGNGRGMFYCIDATKKGDITESGCIWKYADVQRTMSTVAVYDGLVYIPDVTGMLQCLDADTGQCIWKFDTKAETWGGPLLADGKLYMGNKKSYHILAAGRELNPLSEIRLGAPAYSTAVAANGVVYVTSQRYLWAVQQDP